jgi:hypothetical protein
MEKVTIQRFTPEANVVYVLVDRKSGFTLGKVSVPPTLVEAVEIPDGQCAVVPMDQRMPEHAMRLDMRKVRKAINYVDSLESVQSTWRMDAPDAAIASLEQKRDEAIDTLDTLALRRMVNVRGPLADLHSEKLRQALAGGGPLIVDEKDRASVLANAEAEAAKLGEIEAKRRTLKAELRAAKTEQEIASVMDHLMSIKL